MPDRIEQKEKVGREGYGAKAYVQRWEEQDSPYGRHLEYFFTASPENAATWPAKDEADIDCKWVFERSNIRILSARGGITFAPTSNQRNGDPVSSWFSVKHLSYAND